MITPSGTPTAGEIFSLNCSVSGTTDPTTYQWFEGSASSGTQLTNVSQLEFPPLRASDAGLYTCQAINSMGGVVMKGSITLSINRKTNTIIFYLCHSDSCVGVIQVFSLFQSQLLLL